MNLPSRHASQRGFSLLEIVVALALLTIVIVGAGYVVQGGLRVTREVEEERAVLNQAQAYMDQIWLLPFGSAVDTDPAPADVSELFDGDADVPDLTLHQLARWPEGDGGWSFTLADFPVKGSWRVRVDHDLDGDGVVAGSVEESSRIYRIIILFDERVYLESARALDLGG